MYNEAWNIKKEKIENRDHQLLIKLLFIIKIELKFIYICFYVKNIFFFFYFCFLIFVSALFKTTKLTHIHTHTNDRIKFLTFNVKTLNFANSQANKQI